MWHSDLIIKNYRLTINSYLHSSVWPPWQKDNIFLCLHKIPHISVSAHCVSFVTSKSLVLSSLHFPSSIYTPYSPWAFSSQDSPIHDLSDFPCMRDVSLTKSPPGTFCGLGVVCAYLLCSREHKAGPSTQDAFHQ